jgi:hypothetical protein
MDQKVKNLAFRFEPVIALVAGLMPPHLVKLECAHSDHGLDLGVA